MNTDLVKMVYTRIFDQSQDTYGLISFGGINFEESDEMEFPGPGCEVNLLNSETGELFKCSMHKKQRRIDRKDFWTGTNVKFGDLLGIAIIDGIVIYGPYRKTVEELSYIESVKIVEKDLGVKVPERETTYANISDYIGEYGSLVYQRLVKTHLNEDGRFTEELKRVDDCIENLKYWIPKQMLNN